MSTDTATSRARTGSYFIASQSVFWILAAAFLLLVPSAFMAVFFATAPTSSQIVIARLFGAELTGLALSSWVSREIAARDKQRALYVSYACCNTLGFLVTLVAGLQNVLLGPGWILVGLYFLYATGFFLLLAMPE